MKKSSIRAGASPVDVSGVEEALYDIADMISLPEALELLNTQGLKFSREALKRWVKKYGIGHKVAGRFFIDPEKLKLLLQGKIKKG